MNSVDIGYYLVVPYLEKLISAFSILTFHDCKLRNLILRIIIFFRHEQCPC